MCFWLFCISAHIKVKIFSGFFYLSQNPDAVLILKRFSQFGHGSPRLETRCVSKSGTGCIFLVALALTFPILLIARPYKSTPQESQPGTALRLYFLYLYYICFGHLSSGTSERSVCCDGWAPSEWACSFALHIAARNWDFIWILYLLGNLNRLGIINLNYYQKAI